MMVIPPFGYAEYATLNDFCKILSIDIDKAKILLKQKGVTVQSTKETLKTISAKNGITPKDIFVIIKDKTTRAELPTELPIGIAHKSLIELANEYNINLDKFMKHLKDYNMKATANDKFKKIAKQNNLHPAELYNMLLASQK